MDFYNKALKINEGINNKNGIAMCLGNIGAIFYEQGEYKESLTYLSKSKKIYEEIHIILGLDVTTKHLFDVYKNLGDNGQALAMYELHIKLKDSLASMDGTEKTKQREFREKYMLEKQADSIKYSNEILIVQAEAKNERTIRISLMGGISLSIIFLILVFFQLKKTNAQKLIIEANQKHITENINYAEKIQQTLLPEKKLMQNFFSDFFVLYQPKDIVGGDFFWFRCFGDLAAIACVDCTGHGVAGGFMSMMGSLLLDKIIQNDQLKPDEILNQLNNEIIRVLKQDQGDGGEIQDGMDLSLCIINKKKRQLHFSGARNGITVIDDNNISSYKADMLPAGGVFSKKRKNITREFTTQTIELTVNSWIIMSSDGYYDQLGDDKMISMGEKKFQTLAHKAVTTKKDKVKFLTREFNKWKGSHQQIDDLLVIGLKV